MLVEFKLGAAEVDEGVSYLCEIKHLVRKKNEEESQCPIPLPTLKLVITGTQYGYRRDNGVLVVPIGCLRD